MKKIIYCIGVFLLFIVSCDKTQEPFVKGYYTDEGLYEVVAIGMAKEGIEKDVQSRNMAKEAALIVAQKKVMDEFKIPEGKVIPSGIIKSTEFINNRTCKIVYVVNPKKF